MIPREDQEARVREILGAARLKEVPQAVTAGYLKDLHARIEAGERQRALMAGIGVTGLLIAVLGAAWFFLSSYGVHVRVATPPVAGVTEDIQKAADQPAKALSELTDQELDQMGKDLFILEVLGEAEGLMEDLESVGADLEFLSGPGIQI